MTADDAICRELFRLGRVLYVENKGSARVRETAVRMMAMAESVIGQQPNWPANIPIRYQHLTVYPSGTEGYDLRKERTGDGRPSRSRWPLG